MKRLISLAVLVLASLVSRSQVVAGSVEKVKSVNAYVKTIDNTMIKATLRGVNDSVLLLTSSEGKQWQIPAENIESFSVRRKNSIAKGALIGFGIGAVTGIITGLASGDDPVSNEPLYDFSSVFDASINTTAGGKAVSRGLGFGVAGAIIGGITGALLKKKFTIGGRKETFRDLQSEIMNKLVRK